MLCLRSICYLFVLVLLFSPSAYSAEENSDFGAQAWVLELPRGLTDQQFNRVARYVGELHHWFPVREEPGLVQMTLKHRGVSATVTFVVREDRVFLYAKAVDAKGFPAMVPERWIQSLRKDLNFQFSSKK